MTEKKFMWLGLDHQLLYPFLLDFPSMQRYTM
jgi:hypothetical protein